MPKIESLHGTMPAEIFESGLENAGEVVTAVLRAMGRNDPRARRTMPSP